MAYSKPLRAAVIGAGRISQEHLRFLSGAGAESGAAQLVGVCDLSPAMVKYAVERFGAGAGYTDHLKMLEEAKLDVVHVLTPAQSHVRLVRDCLAAGAHVIVEKPIAANHRGFLELWEAARAADRRLIEDHNYRFNAPILEIHKLVTSGKLGEVSEVDVRMALAVRGKGGGFVDESLPHPSHAMPAGMLHDFITHFSYLVLQYLPSVDRVSAAWRKHGSEPLIQFDDLDATILGGAVHGRIRFSSHAGPDCFTFTVRGSKGWAETDLFQSQLRVVMPRPGGKHFSSLVNHWINGYGMMRGGVRGVINKFMQRNAYEGLQTFLGMTYEALQKGAEPPVGFADMDRTSRLIDALLDEKNRI